MNETVLSIDQAAQAVAWLAVPYCVLISICVCIMHPKLKPILTCIICTATSLGALWILLRLTGNENGRDLISAILAVLVVFLFKDPLVIKITVFCQAAILASLIDTASWIAAALWFNVPVTEILCQTPTQIGDVAFFTRIFTVVALIPSAIIWVHAWNRVIKPLPQNALNSVLALLSVQAVAQVYLLSYILMREPTIAVALPICFTQLIIGDCALVLLYTFFYFFGQDATEQSRQAALASTAELQKRYLQDLQAYADSVSNLRSSGLESFAKMRTLISSGDTAAFLQYIGDVATTAQNNIPAPYSNSVAVSSLLNEKAAECQKHNINLRIPTRIEIFVVTEFEACTILSNVLDNAIRATRVLPDKQRWITLSLMHSGGLTIFTCRNSYDPQAPKRRNPMEHGAGLSIVRTIVSRYMGSVQLKHDQGVFTFLLSFYGTT